MGRSSAPRRRSPRHPWLPRRLRSPRRPGKRCADKPVMATGVFFITIETEAQTTSFCHLVRGEASLIALVATLLGGRRGSKKCRRLQGCRESWPGRGGGQQAVRGRPRGRLHPSVQLLQLHLARQTHGRRERRRVVDADDVA
jgi:hypothetical protein